MLEELALRDLGVIEEAVLEFSPGFTVVTGETGAGKTMVVTALGLLLGRRADAGAVRGGAARAQVDGRVRAGAESPAAARVREAGGELDDGVLLLGRTVAVDGRSKAYAGGRGVPASLLAEIAGDLVAVHGQADQQRLTQAAAARELLDRFAGEPAETALADYRAAYDEVRALRAELAEVTTRARERAQEAEALRHALAEVAAVEPVAGEEEQLRAEVGRLAHAEALRTAAAAAHEMLTADGAARDLAAEAGRQLGAQQGHDPVLDELAARLAEVGYLLGDIGTELAGYVDGLEADPARLQAAQERLAALGGLRRRYGDDISAVLAWVDSAQVRLSELDDDDGRRQRLADRLAQREPDLAAAAQRLSEERGRAAERLSRAVTAELSALALPHAELRVTVTPRDGFGPHGADDVEFLFVPHPGAPGRPVGRGASGGELSRLMLAVEVCLAGVDPVATFVFDEVDAGIGGRAAVEVGKRLAALARHAQVIVVTHLPQVAAFADRHLVVVKRDDGTVTRSGVGAVEGEDRVRELSRMLAGWESSALALGHAEELLAAAAAEKATPVVAR